MIGLLENDSINNQAVASGHVEKPEPSVFSADETASVGIDLETPVAADHNIQVT